MCVQKVQFDGKSSITDNNYKRLRFAFQTHKCDRHKWNNSLLPAVRRSLSTLINAARAAITARIHQSDAILSFVLVSVLLFMHVIRPTCFQAAIKSHLDGTSAIHHVTYWTYHQQLLLILCSVSSFGIGHFSRKR